MYDKYDITYYNAYFISKLTKRKNDYHWLWFKIKANLFICYAPSIAAVVPVYFSSRLSVIEFRKIIEMKRRLRRAKGLRVTKEATKKYRFTRLILALTFICICTRSIDTAVIITRRMQWFSWISLSEVSDNLGVFARRFAYLLIFAEHGLDNILYYIYDFKTKSR